MDHLLLTGIQAHICTLPILINRTMDHPIGTKATKRATKAKSKAKSSNFLDLKGMEEIIKTKTKTLENLACAKHEINKVKIKGSQ